MDNKVYMLINGVPECESTEWTKSWRGSTDEQFDMAARVTCAYPAGDQLTGYRDLAKAIVHAFIPRARVTFVDDDEHTKLIGEGYDE